MAINVVRETSIDRIIASRRMGRFDLRDLNGALAIFRLKQIDAEFADERQSADRFIRSIARRSAVSIQGDTWIERNSKAS